MKKSPKRTASLSEEIVLFEEIFYETTEADRTAISRFCKFLMGDTVNIPLYMDWLNYIVVKYSKEFPRYNYEKLEQLIKEQVK